MGCLHLIEELAEIEIPDVYMDNENFKALKPENKRILERKHQMEAILETREKLARDGNI